MEGGGCFRERVPEVRMVKGDPGSLADGRVLSTPAVWRARLEGTPMKPECPAGREFGFDHRGIVGPPKDLSWEVTWSREQTCCPKPEWPGG